MATLGVTKPEDDFLQEAESAKGLAKRFPTPAAAAEFLIRCEFARDATLLKRPLVGLSLEPDLAAVAEFAAHLARRGWAAAESIGLPQSLLEACAREAVSVGSRMQPGLISRPSACGEQDIAKRGDEVVWLTQGAELRRMKHESRHGSQRQSVASLNIGGFPYLKHLMQDVLLLGYALAKKASIPVDGHTDVMLARYGADGAFYTPHVDSGLSDPRALTIVLYLNPGWEEEHRGCLQVLDPHTFEWLSIPPRLGSLAVFRASDILHQVKPSYAPRYALTIWMAQEGLTAADWERCD